MEKDAKTQEPLYENSDLSFSDETENEMSDLSIADLEPWLIENIDRDKSESILTNYKECYQSGTFLIRKSESNSTEYPYTLCVL
jgi:hypothetical protein